MDDVRGGRSGRKVVRLGWVLLREEVRGGKETRNQETALSRAVTMNVDDEGRKK
jgi:hypothetical protein